LTGFGFTVYHLYRLSYFDQLDEELTHRVAALSNNLRGGRGPGGPGGPGRPPPFDDHGPRRFRGGEHMFPDGDGPPSERRGGKPSFDEEGERGGRRRRGGDGPFRDGPEG